MKECDTFPKFIVDRYEQWPDKVAMRKKDFGIWKELTWRDVYENVRYLSLCFIELGLQRGDRVAVIGENEPEWFCGEFAAQAAGGALVGIYTDMVPAQVEFMFSHSEAVIAVANDQEQVDKFLEIREKIPRLKKIIYWDPKGLRNYHDPLLMSFTEAIELGKSYDKKHPDAFEKNVSMGKGEDIAALFYTSGTSGEPKAGMVTHRALINSGESFLAYNPLAMGDNMFSFLPAAWIGECLFSTASHVTGGIILNFAEEPETVQEDLREIAPTVIIYGPRQWEDMASTIQVRIIEADAINRLLYNLCLKIGYKRVELIEKGIKGSLPLRFLIKMADWLIFKPLTENFGFTNCKIAATGSAAMSVDTFRFWSALGIRLKQVYASTEGGFIAGHHNEIYFETVGTVAVCAKVKISEKQEIMVSGPQIFSGYFKNPQKTEETLVDGWIHTGDCGFIDKKGHLVFLDRLSDMANLNSGTMYAPQYIEGRLRFSPYIKDAMSLGEKRDFVAVIVIIDFENVGKWAEEHHINYTTFADLSQKKEIATLIAKDIRRVNDGFAGDTKVKKFVLLHKEFDPDEDELTRTRKIRRGFMEERYKELVEAIYSGKSGVEVESQVKYQDGRQATMKTHILIWAPEEEKAV